MPQTILGLPYIGDSFTGYFLQAITSPFKVSYYIRGNRIPLKSLEFTEFIKDKDIATVIFALSEADTVNSLTLYSYILSNLQNLN